MKGDPSAARPTGHEAARGEQAVPTGTTGVDVLDAHGDLEEARSSSSTRQGSELRLTATG
jgi:hypothetical protein